MVHRVWRCDVDHIYVRVGHERRVAGMPIRDAKLLRETVSRSLASRPHGDRNAGIAQLQVGHEYSRDPAGTENPPPHWAALHAPSFRSNR
jgi:hypothetical protein